MTKEKDAIVEFAVQVYKDRTGKDPSPEMRETLEYISLDFLKHLFAMLKYEQRRYTMKDVDNEELM
jgi:hypothetical protein